MTSDGPSPTLSPTQDPGVFLAPPAHLAPGHGPIPAAQLCDLPMWVLPLAAGAGWTGQAAGQWGWGW